MSVKELSDKLRKREQRKLHVRKTLSGTPEKPRMTVFKSNKYLYVQVIDDVEGNTLASASSLEESLKGFKRNLDGAGKLGEEIGKRLKEKKGGRGGLRPQRLQVPRHSESHRRRRPQGRDHVLGGRRG
jgi:large subunit ribosomal protein L18